MLEIVYGQGKCDCTTDIAHHITGPALNPTHKQGKNHKDHNQPENVPELLCPGQGNPFLSIHIFSLLFLSIIKMVPLNTSFHSTP